MTHLLIPLILATSPYIDRVYEYCPAPGQFINELPYYESGDDANEMALKAEESIAGQTFMLVSLGGYGGYITFGFDHTIENIPGERDFKILANAFYANANPNPDAPAEGGSCEPGIVMVSRDINGNGKPDDPWYELAGSEYNSPSTIHNYSITYYKPDESKERVPMEGYEFLNDITYIRWTTNTGEDSFMARNVFHDQSYWPQWIPDETLTFTGTRLANNYVEESGTGTYYVLYAYPWGYVDNHPNQDIRSGFDISWAVDNEGKHVDLDGIDFVKVYTGVNQYCGWLGETSTEIIGAYDMHLLPDGDDNHDGDYQPGAISAPSIKESDLRFYQSGDILTVIGCKKDRIYTISDLRGVIIKKFRANGPEHQISTSDLPHGIYFIAGHKVIL